MSLIRNKDLNIKPKYGFFYILHNHMGRVKIGITQNPKQRLGQYMTHGGDGNLVFDYLYFGDWGFIKKMERLIKTKEEFHIFDGERTSEWLLDEYKLQDIKILVDTLRYKRAMQDDIVEVTFTKLNYSNLSENMINESLKHFEITE